MFNPNDQGFLPLLAIRSTVVSSESSKPSGQRNHRRSLRRVRPNIVRLIPGVTKLPIGYSAR